MKELLISTLDGVSARFVVDDEDQALKVIFDAMAHRTRALRVGHADGETVIAVDHIVSAQLVDADLSSPDEVAVEAPEDIQPDVPAMLDKIASLEARVSTLVESEARAIASEKAAREALEKIDTKRIRELVFELRRGQWTNVAAAILAALGDAPVVDHGPDGVGC